MILLFAVIDTLLARAQHSHATGSAARLYRLAEEARQAGNRQTALDLHREAWNRARSNRDYEFALATSFAAMGKSEEAEARLQHLLDQDPSAGRVNLEMARLYARRENPTQASWFYHRALYGTWDGNASAARREIRFEIADLLARSGRSEEVMAELLPLQSDTEADEATLERIASLWLSVKAWDRAASLYQTLLQKRPGSPVALAGLGTAQLGKEQYTQARQTLRAAVAAGAGQQARQELALVEQLIAFDPTSRSVPPTERLRRANQLLDLLRERFSACAPSPESEASSPGKAVSKKRPVEIELELKLNELGQWAKHAKDCIPQTAESGALRLTLERLER